MDEPRVREAKKELASKMSEKQQQRYFPRLPTYLDMVDNMENYEKEPHLFKIGSFVYVDKVEDQMAKSDEYKRGRVYVISEILKHERPLRYRLEGLLIPPEKIPG